MTDSGNPDPLSRLPIRALAEFMRTSALVGVISLVLGAVVLFVVLWRTGFGPQEALYGVFRAEMPMPAIMPAIGTVLSAFMIWRQMGDAQRWLKEALPALAAGYFLAVGLWVVIAQIVTGEVA